MPIVRIDIEAGKTTQYRRAILHAVRRAVTSALQVPDDRVVSRLIEAPAENIDATDVRSDRLTVIEISMLSGRDAEKKSALFAAITEGLREDPGVAPHDIFVVVHDTPAECLCAGEPPSAPAEASLPVVHDDDTLAEEPTA